MKYLLFLLAACGPPMSPPDAGIDATVIPNPPGLGTNEQTPVLEVPADASTDAPNAVDAP